MTEVAAGGVTEAAVVQGRVALLLEQIRLPPLQPCDQKGKNRIGLTKGDTIKVTAEI